jgi:hypothetical protein
LAHPATSDLIEDQIPFPLGWVMLGGQLIARGFFEDIEANTLKLSRQELPRDLGEFGCEIIYRQILAV